MDHVTWSFHAQTICWYPQKLVKGPVGGKRSLRKELKINHDKVTTDNSQDHEADNIPQETTDNIPQEAEDDPTDLLADDIIANIIDDSSTPTKI